MYPGGEAGRGRRGVRAALLLSVFWGAPIHPVGGAAATAAQTVPTPGAIRVDSVPGAGIAVTLAYIPAGTFTMGSPAEEAGRDPDEGPQRAVRLPGFWMGVHEVTTDQFAPFRYPGFDDDTGPAGPGSFDVDAVARPSPPYQDPAHGMGRPGHPAAGMTRWTALHYARWLSEKTGRLYRLPTEAEWEYACRAGGRSPWGFGADPAGAGDHAWLTSNSGGTHHPVGERRANRWGLHDMHGNVAEWVMDGYAAAGYGEPAPAAGPDGAVDAPRAGDAWRGQGVVRGGAFDDAPVGARCAERFPETPAWKRRDPQIPRSRWWNTDSPHVGFRLVSPDREYTLEEVRAYWAEILGG